MKIWRCLALANIAAAITGSAVAGEIHTFFAFPTVDGVPLDWCNSGAQSCGWPSAHDFCRVRSFERALHFEVFNSGRTYISADNRFCTGPTCTAFKSVICNTAATEAAAAAPPKAVGSAQVRFDYPRNDSVPADWCREQGTDCGLGGASRFCESRGFDRALDFSTYRPGTTRVAGDAAHCTGPGCIGLRHVICEGR